jgi:hypothetical protein
MFQGWMMSCAASPLILVPNYFWQFPILSILEILSGIALDVEQIHLTHILLTMRLSHHLSVPVSCCMPDTNT